MHIKSSLMDITGVHMVVECRWEIMAIAKKGKSSVQKPEPTLGNFIKCMESNGVKYKFKGGQNE